MNTREATRRTLQAEVEPLDPLIFGDSRSARAGDDHRRGAQDLSPQTLYGALGAHLAGLVGAAPGRWNGEAEALLGRFCCTLEGAEDIAQLLAFVATDPEGEAWFPRPEHLPILAAGARKQALAPRSPDLSPGDEQSAAILSSLSEGLVALIDPPASPEGSAEDGSRELAGKDIAAGHRVSQELLAAVLTATFQPQDFDLESHLRPEEAFFQDDSRIGVGMDNATNVAVAGRLFSRPYRRFAERVGATGVESAGFRAFYQVLDLGTRAPADLDGIAFLGADRRRVCLRWREDEPFRELQRALRGTPETGRGFLAYLLTPAVAGAALPPLADRGPVAAALGKPQQVSGWRSAGSQAGPRGLRRLLPSGSVLFYPWRHGEDTAERRRILNELWLTPLDPLHAAAGFGRVLPGVWT